MNKLINEREKGLKYLSVCVGCNIQTHIEILKGVALNKLRQVVIVRRSNNGQFLSGNFFFFW